MNPNDPQPEPADPDPIDGAELEAFMDGTMQADAAEAFARRLENDPTRAQQVDLQRRIDARLRDQLAWTVSAVPPALPGLNDGPNPVAAGHTSGRATDTAPDSASVLYRMTRPLRLVAAVVILSLIGVVIAVYVNPPGAISLAPVYHAEIDAGFVPGWICETDAEFIETFAKRFQTPLRLREAAGIEAIGLTYNYALGPRTVMLLAQVDGQPVIVFVGSTRLVDPPPRVGDRDLSIFERQVGATRLFELTPFDRPRVLDQFELVDDFNEADPEEN